MDETAKLLVLVRMLKAHGHDAWLNVDGSIGVIEPYTKDGVFGQKRAVIEAPTHQSVRDWLGY